MFFFFINTFSGHIEVVKLLVAHGAEVTCKDKKSYTPLHAAASSGMISVVKYLLDLGVDVGVQTKQEEEWSVLCVCGFIVSGSFFKFKRCFLTVTFLSFNNVMFILLYIIYSLLILTKT